MNKPTTNGKTGTHSAKHSAARQPANVPKTTPPKSPQQRPKNIQHNAPSKTTQWTNEAAQRIQTAETLAQNGTVRKGSFASHAMSQAAKKSARKLTK